MSPLSRRDFLATSTAISSCFVFSKQLSQTTLNKFALLREGSEEQFD